MTELRWRGDPSLRLPYRDFIRQELPGPDHGVVAHDIDLVERVFGPNYGCPDRWGKFRFLEVKCAAAEGMTNGERLTYELLDELLQAADPHHRRYLGSFTIWTEAPDWAECDYFEVERLDREARQFTRSQFLHWLNFGVSR